MEQVYYAFTIFFLTIGPLKVIPPFFILTKDLSEKALRQVAFKASLFSLIFVLIFPFLSTVLLTSWRISVPSVTVAGSIFLFLSAFKIITEFKPSSMDVKKGNGEKKDIQHTAKELSIMALSPLTVPVIISPIGIVAIIATTSIAKTYNEALIRVELTGALILIVLLNLISMILSRVIMKFIGIQIFAIIGWVFAIFQAGLAVQFITNALHKLF